jgi:hypothetical protein
MMTPLVQSPNPRSVARHVIVPVSTRRARALGHRLGAASMGWRGLIRLPGPGRGTNKTSLKPGASRAARKPAALDARYTSVRRAVRAPV